MTEQDHPPSPEFGTQPEHLQAVVGLVGELEYHNATYTTKAGIACRALGLTPGVDNPLDYEDCAERLSAWLADPTRPSLPQEQNTDRAILSMAHAETLAGTGLRLGPIRTTETIHTATHGYERIGSVRLVPADGYTFVRFINTVADGPFTVEVHEAIEDIVRHSFDDFSQDLLDTDDMTAASELTAYTIPIADALERMGSDDKPLLESLYQCNAHTKTDTVREWMVANHIFFFDAVDDAEQVGPSFWHRRLSPEGMFMFWSVIKDLIIQTSGYRAPDFHAQLVQGAWEHLEYSEKDWHRLVDSGEESDLAYMIVFTEIRTSLRQLKEL